MEFISVKREQRAQGSPLLAIGKHIAKITEVSPATPKGKDKAPWDDTTPQLIVKFENDEGYISNWYNLKGYQRKYDFADGVAPKGHSFASSDKPDGTSNNEQYLMNIATMERVESIQRTEDAQRIFCELAQSAGIEIGAKFTEKDLLNKDVEVVVHQHPKNASKVAVHYVTDGTAIEA